MHPSSEPLIDRTWCWTVLAKRCQRFIAPAWTTEWPTSALWRSWPVSRTTCLCCCRAWRTSPKKTLWWWRKSRTARGEQGQCYGLRSRSSKQSPNLWFGRSANSVSVNIDVQGAWRKAEAAAREAERKDEKVFGAIPGRLQESSKSLIFKNNSQECNILIDIWHTVHNRR